MFQLRLVTVTIPASIAAAAHAQVNMTTQHNVVYVATQSDQVYAFDANSNDGASAPPLWQASMLSTAHGATSGARLYGRLGIVGTPVIDPTSKRIGISNAPPVQGGPPPVARNRPYVASKLRGRVACLGYLGRQ